MTRPLCRCGVDVDHASPGCVEHARREREAHPACAVNVWGACARQWPWVRCHALAASLWLAGATMEAAKARTLEIASGAACARGARRCGWW